MNITARGGQREWNANANEEAEVSKLRFNITMSLDGFVAGPHQGPENPLGVGGTELHQWLYPLAVFRETHGERGGEVNASTAVVEG